MRRVFYVFTAFIIISFLVVGGALNYMAHSYMQQATEEEVERDLEILIATTKGALAQSDYERVEEQVFLWSEIQPNIIIFNVILEGDIPIVKFARQTQAPDIFRHVETEALPSGQNITFEVHYDLSELHRKTSIIAVALLLMSTCVAGIFIFFLWTILQRLAFIPLQREIAERKEVELELKKNAVYIDTMGDALLVLDTQHKVIRINKATEKLWGYSSSEMLGIAFEHFFPEEDYGIHTSMMSKAAQGKTVAFFEANILTKSQKTVATHISGTVITNDKGDVTGFVGVFTDVSERKKAEKEREKLLRVLQEKNDELQTIIYIASHDLRSPIINIAGFCGELGDSCKQMQALLESETPGAFDIKRIKSLLNEDIPESLNFITGANDKLKKLLDGFLQVSRAGTAGINIEPLDMNKLVANICQVMKFQIDSTETEIAIDHLPKCLGDKTMIDQVFSKIIANALKYLDPERKGRIHISGRIEDNMSIYCIEDNGIGIAHAHQPKIFELFHRLNPNDTVGEGVGLTIVSRILYRNQGRIWLESEPGKGSKFFVSLPSV